MLPQIFAILLVILVGYIIFKILAGFIKNLVLIILAIIAILIIFQSFPGVQSSPFFKFLPKLPSSISDIINTIKNFLWKIEVVTVGRDAENNLLITVVNKGRFSVSNFTVWVDGSETNIMNKPLDPLPAGKSTVIQIDWKKNFKKIEIKTKQTITVYGR